MDRNTNAPEEASEFEGELEAIESMAIGSQARCRRRRRLRGMCAREGCKAESVSYHCPVHAAEQAAVMKRARARAKLKRSKDGAA